MPSTVALASPVATALATPGSAHRTTTATFNSRKTGQPHVLIVMHNTAERLLLKQMAQMEGYAVHTSGTGLEALQVMAANQGTYAICLMDTVLPDLDPHALCSQMSELVRGGVSHELHTFRLFFICEFVPLCVAKNLQVAVRHPDNR